MKCGSVLAALVAVGCGGDASVDPSAAMAPSGRQSAIDVAADDDGPLYTTDATWAQWIAQTPAPPEERTFDPVHRERIAHPVAVELATRLARGERPTDDQWVEALLQSGAVSWRSVWPVEVPWVVSMRVPIWLGLAEIELRPRTDGFATAHAGMLWIPQCGMEALSSEWRANRQELGTVRLSEQSVEFDAVVLWGSEPYAFDFPALPSPRQEVAWKGTLTLPVRGVASLVEALPPVSSPEVAAAVRRAISVSTRNNNLRLEYSPGNDPLLRGLGLALEVDVHHGGQLRESLDFGSLTESNSMLRQQVSRGGGERGLSPETRLAIAESRAVTLRVRGKLDPALLFDWDCDRHFAGSFELSLP